MSEQPSYTTVFKASFADSEAGGAHKGYVLFEREDRNLAKAEYVGDAVLLTGRVRVYDELENLVLTIDIRDGVFTLSDLEHKNVAFALRNGAVPEVSASAEENDHNSLGVVFTGLAGMVLRYADKPAYALAAQSLQAYFEKRLQEAVEVPAANAEQGEEGAAKPASPIEKLLAGKPKGAFRGSGRGSYSLS